MKNRPITSIVKMKLIVLLLLCSLSAKAQQAKVDSIKKIVAKKELMPSFEKDTTYIVLLNDLSYNYIAVNIDSTNIVGKKALKYSQALGYYEGEIKSYTNIGIYYSEKGNKDKAFDYFNKAYNLAIDKDISKALFNIYNALGVEYSMIGEYKLSLEFYLKALEEAESRKSKTDIALVNINLGTLFSCQYNYKEARTYFEEANEFYRAHKEMSLNNLVVKINLSMLYSEIGENEKGLKIVDSLINTFNEFEDGVYLSELYHTKASIFHNKKQYKKSIRLNKKSLSYRRVEDLFFEGGVNVDIAKAYLGLENYDSAYVYANRSYKQCTITNVMDDIIESSEILYLLYKRKHVADSTVKYLEKFKLYSDSLYNDINRNSIMFYKVKSDFDKKQNELKIESDKKIIIKQNRINIALLIIGILFCTLIPLYLKHKKQQELNKQLVDKSNLLINNEKDLLKLNETKNRLFSIIGHDLKGPIGGMNSLLEMHNEENGVSDLDIINIIPKLKKDISSIYFTLNNLLNWGKTQIKGEVIYPKQFLIATLVEENLNFLNSFIVKKKLTIINKINTEDKVFADRDYLNIVMRNLISNAIKFTPVEGKIKLYTEYIDNTCKISIEDSGIGMDETVQIRIFDETDNLTTFGTEKESGTGLGLKISKAFIEKNNGKIWVESKLGHGSTFHILLPC